MTRIRRYFGTFLLGAVLVLPMAATGCAVRYYDGGRYDHRWERERREREWREHERREHERREHERREHRDRDHGDWR